MRHLQVLERLPLMNRRSSTVALSAAFCSLFVGCGQDMEEPLLAPSVVLATLQSEAFIPKRTAGSCETFSGEHESLSEDQICVSNSCGFGEATFRVDTLLVGSVRPTGGVLRYALNEWCEPEFPLSRDVLLVAVDVYDAAAGEHEFRYERTFRTEEGELYLVPDVITDINGIELRALAKPLDDPLVYGEVADWTPAETEHLLSVGFVKVVEGMLVADVGVYVVDLIDALEKP